MQVCDAGWELYCLERGIQPDGQMATGSTSAFNFYDPHFFDYSPAQYVPRATFSVLEPIVFDKVRSSMCIHYALLHGHQYCTNLLQVSTAGSDMAEEEREEGATDMVWFSALPWHCIALYFYSTTVHTMPHP
jgi:hypothetical protein